MQKQNSRLLTLKRWSYVWVEAGKNFIADECYLRASALTFYSLLSIVPVLAVIFGIAKGFGFEKIIQEDLAQKFVDQKEVFDKFIEFSQTLLESVQGGVIAGVGVLVLLWTAFGLLNNIESALNVIWKIKKGRSYSRKISDFLAFILICPIFFIAVSSLNVFISTQITLNPHNYTIIKAASPFLIQILKLFPYFLSWILFTFIYLVMPHASVSIKAGSIAGIIAGTAFQLWQWIYIKFQIGASSYGAIYGSFAALPLFLIWLQISWLIVFAGAEIAASLDRDPLNRLVERSLFPVKALAVLIAYRCIDAFEKVLTPPTDRALAQTMGLELEDVYKICEALENHHILVATASGTKIRGYVPARDVRTIYIKDVLDAVEKSEQILANINQSTELDNVLEYLQLVDRTLNEPNLHRLMVDLNKKTIKLDSSNE